MDFLKKNSYDIVRMFITQIGISVFSFIMLISFQTMSIEEGSFGYITGMIAVSVFSTGFYFILLYTSAWDWGAKDKIRIDAGKLRRNNAKMLIMSAIANLPNFIIVLFSIICLIFSVCDIKFIFYAAGTLSATLLRLISNMFVGATGQIFAFLKDSTEGADNSLYDLMQMISFALLYLVTILVCHLGYSLGIREKRIFGFIKRKPKKYE